MTVINGWLSAVISFVGLVSLYCWILKNLQVFGGVAAFLYHFQDTDGMLVYRVQDIQEKIATKYYEGLMVFVWASVICLPFESGADDDRESNNLLAGLKDLLVLVSGLENKRSTAAFPDNSKEK